MSESNLSIGEDTQLLIVDDMDEVPIPRYLSGNSTFAAQLSSEQISPPPLIGLDRPGPPNVAMLPYSTYCRSSSTSSSPAQANDRGANSPNYSSSAYITSLKNSYHHHYKSATVYRMSPCPVPVSSSIPSGLIRLTSRVVSDLKSPELPELDLDRMYLDVVTEDYKTAITSLLPQLSIAKMDPLSQVFCLRWNNHRNNLLTVLDNLLQTEAFCDVTLACDNTSIKCHKMILSACSTYFQTLFMENNCEHPIVFLKDIKYSEIRAILDYMYKGEVNVAQEELPGLLKVAELLRVKGLVEEEREKLLNSNFIPTNGGTNGGGAGQRHEERGKNGGRATSNEEQERERENDRERERERNRTPKVNGGSEHSSRERDSVFAERKEREREREQRERERERDRERHRERVRSADAAIKDSPPSTSSIVPPMVRPFMYTPPPGAPTFPMFPLPGMFTGAQHLFGGGDNDKDDSASLQGMKRKKVASGSGGSSSSKESSGLGNLMSRDRDNHESNDMRGLDEKSHGGNSSDTEKDGFGGLDKSGIANYVPNQRLEWKRYKQYTRNDIMAAIEEVKAGMSALQASRKYGVPSRTLYDKVKKMGITTGRQMQKKSLPNYPASFPPLGVMGMHESFKDADDRDDTNDSSLGAAGDLTDGRATMVPPSGFSTLQMLNLMKEMKEAELSGKSDHHLHHHGGPINLSNMLSERHLKRRSDSSLSPRSPTQGHYGGHDDDDEDIEDMSDVERDDRDDGVDSSVTRRSRHSSGDIRAQFMADLRRLGGNIPHYNHRSGGSGDEPASSTTVSPPPHGIRLPLPPPLLQLPPSEDSLPPRKRKVSQEHHSGRSDDLAATSSSPYNGVHNTPNGGNGNESESSGISSPEKDVNRRRNDEPMPSPSLPCRN